MYKLFYSTNPKVIIEIKGGPYSTFGLAKKALYETFNRLMWQGTICFWVNNITFKGNIDGVETVFFLKKV